MRITGLFAILLTAAATASAQQAVTSAKLYAATSIVSSADIEGCKENVLRTNERTYSCLVKQREVSPLAKTDKADEKVVQIRYAGQRKLDATFTAVPEGYTATIYLRGRQVDIKHARRPSTYLKQAFELTQGKELRIAYFAPE